MHDRLRRVRRRLESEPQIEIDARVSKLSQSRNFRHDGRAFGSGRRDDAQSAGTHVREDGVDCGEGHMDLAADEIGDRLRLPAIGHVLHVETELLLEQFHPQLLQRADAGRGIIVISGFSFDRRNQLGERIDGKYIWVDREDDGVGRQPPMGAKLAIGS